MTDREEGLLLFSRREEFLERVTDRLGTHPTDFAQELALTTAGGAQCASRLAAGVLLPLVFSSPSPRRPAATGEFVFRLIKRSSLVTQPGDLSCPGGMVHPVVDRLLRPLVAHGPLPVLRGRARSFLRQRGAVFYRIVTLFLANALRETWEEIGLPPWRVRFLGPLPTYSLTRFRRTIFPVAGAVDDDVPLRLNREVERIVDIPLRSFYRERQIGCYILTVPDPSDSGSLIPLHYPCLIHRPSGGEEEILWGATFHIITRFLSLVMEYQLPDWQNGPVVRRQMRSDYLNERSRR